MTEPVPSLFGFPNLVTAPPAGLNFSKYRLPWRLSGDSPMSFTAQHLYFEDVAIGQEWESLGRTLTEADIVHFAGLSGDFNPIHVDHEFARTTLFGRPIAHGLLVVSMASGLGLFTPPMRTVALMCLREWHFRQPVFIGDTIRVHTQVLAKEARARGKRGVVTWQRQILNQEGQIVQEGVSLTLVECRKADKDAAGDGADPAAQNQG